MALFQPSASFQRSGYMLSARSRSLRASPALLQLRPTRAAKQLGRCLANVKGATDDSRPSIMSSKTTRSNPGEQVVFFTSTELADPSKIQAARQFIGIPQGAGSLGLPDLELPIEGLRSSRPSELKSKSTVTAKQARTAELAAAKQCAANIIADAEQRAADILATAEVQASKIKAKAAVTVEAAGRELAGLELSIAERKENVQKLERQLAELKAAIQAEEIAGRCEANSREAAQDPATVVPTKALIALKTLRRPELEELCAKKQIDYRYKELPVEPLRELVSRRIGLSSSTYPLFIDDMAWDQVGEHNTTLVGLQKYCSREGIVYSRRSKGELLARVIEYKRQTRLRA